MIQVKQTTAVISSYYTQAKAQKKAIRVLSEMSVRLQTIEHRMEMRHMQPPVVTKKMASERVEFRENM